MLDDESLVEEMEVLDDLDAPDTAAPPVYADPIADAVRDGYGKTLRPFHSWLLRKTFDLVSSQLPSFDDAMVMFGTGLGDAEREGSVDEPDREFGLRWRRRRGRRRRVFGSGVRTGGAKP